MFYALSLSLTHSLLVLCPLTHIVHLRCIASPMPLISFQRSSSLSKERRKRGHFIHLERSSPFNFLVNLYVYLTHAQAGDFPIEIRQLQCLNIKKWRTFLTFLSLHTFDTQLLLLGHIWIKSISIYSFMPYPLEWITLQYAYFQIFTSELGHNANIFKS